MTRSASFPMAGRGNSAAGSGAERSAAAGSGAERRRRDAAFL